MPKMTPSWLRDLVQRLEYINPTDMSKAQRTQLRSMRDASHLAQRSALAKDAAHDVNAESMIGAALNRTIAASQFDDVDPRLLLLPDAKSKVPKASVASIHTLGTEPGLPENSLYVETLGSTTPGGGRAVLQHLADQYPDLPIFLNSLEDPATLEFYKRRGFIPQDHADYPELPDHLPLFVLPEGRQLKADGGSVKKMGGALSKLYELLHDTRSAKDAASAFGRGLRVNGVAPAWFEQHRPELIAKALEDKHNLILGLPAKQDIDHALQLMNESTSRNLLTFGAGDDLVRAKNLQTVRPWDGGNTPGMSPYVDVRRFKGSDLLTVLPEHDGRHRLLNAALNNEDSAIQLIPSNFGDLESLADLRGKPTRVGSDFNYPEHYDPENVGEPDFEDPFSYLFRHSFADGGSVDPVREYSKRHPKVPVTLKQGEPFEMKMQRALSALQRGAKNWVPDVAGFVGDITDVGHGATRFLAGQALKGGNRPRDAASAGALRAIAEQPELGAGEGIRALTSESIPSLRGTLDANIQHEKEPWDVGDVARFANPALAVSPRTLMKAADTPTGGRVMGALAAMMGGGGADLSPAMAGIIKNKGGNWLEGVVEKQLSSLHKQQPTAAWDPEEVNRALPLNDWIDKQLTRYVKNDMGTEGDPLRALAEQQGISLIPLGRTNYELNNRLRAKREKAGMPPNLLAKTPLGREWETTADMVIDPQNITKLGKMVRSKNPWLDKLAPGTPVYGTSSSDALVYSTNFQHLIDELHNALDPASGLPRELQLRPESLSRVSVPDAVKRVHEIDKWREAKQAEANAGLANNAATHLVREYPHTPEMPNPKGLRWVELKKPTQPTELPEGYSVAPTDTGGGFYVLGPDKNAVATGKTPEEAVQSWISKDTTAYDALQQSLKYEGDTMGHCVGGYCDDVTSGNTRIFSLRDAKGEPHVTIEVAPQHWFKNADAIPDPTGEFESFHRLVQNRRVGDGDYEDVARRLASEHGIETPTRIVQIKGKANRKPNDEYLPFVQDFVRNSPLDLQWSGVGDIGNTGLQKTEQGYFTQQELENMVNEATKKYASGGMVRTNKELSGMIQQLSSGLH